MLINIRSRSIWVHKGGMMGNRRIARLSLSLGMLVLLLATSIIVPLFTASADPDTPWRGEYYNNVSLSGAPALVRDDASISFDWGASPPATGVNADNLSVRWTNFVSFGGGNYTFRVTTDDGARLWVDDQLLIDQWRDQPATTFIASRSLSAGYHSLRLEYYEHTSNAAIKLWWDTGTSTITDWRGEYYNNTWLGGDPILVRNDTAINFDWGAGSPAAGVNADNYSVRWTREMQTSASTDLVFSATVDDGVRLWVDSVLLIDKWTPQSRTTHSGTIHLTAGSHKIRVEYFEATGAAVAVVSWAAATPTPVTTEVIVDDLSGHFVRGGPTSTWYARSTGYRGHLFWTWNSTNTVRRWAKWFPYVPAAGRWEVYVYIASRYFGSKSARYTIYHNGTRHDRAVNQNIYNDQWVSLGTYDFAGGSGEYVYLGDNTGEANATRYVGFDAARFVKRDETLPPSGCSIVPTLGFARIWNGYASVRTKLGCPAETEKGVWAGEEAFQNGVMFWRQDTRKIYALYNNGTWQTYDDTWTSAEREWDPNIVPPAGLFQPKRGFGKVWRDNPSVRNALGWATMEERPLYASTQPFAGGLMFWSNARGIYVLYNDGRWEHFS